MQSPPPGSRNTSIAVSMVNLTIRLSKGPGAPSVAGGDGSSAISGAGEGPLPPGLDPAVTVSCPDHLVLADLPVAKGLGSASDITLVKVLGRKARRRLGDKVHFCVRCDFPIAIYGRLDPCEHIFCLTCARRDSACYLCGERVLRIQRIEVLDGIFICGAPRCLRSFLKRQDFQHHVKEVHADLVESAEDREKADVQKRAASLEPPQQVQSQILSRSSSGAQLQRSWPAQPELKPDLDYHQQPPSHGDRHRRQQRQLERQEQAHFDKQPLSDPPHVFHVPLQQQQAQPSILPAPPQPGGIPVFSPSQPFTSPYPMHQQDGLAMQPPLYAAAAAYQIPPAGGHLLPSPPLPPPRPPAGAPPPPLLPPPPPPTRVNFEPAMTPSSDSQVGAHGYAWSGSNPNFDPNQSYGSWSAT